MDSAFVGAPLQARSSFVNSSDAAVTRARAPRTRTAPVRMGAGQLREVRDRMSSVKNTQKITDAMRLVAAAKVRRAQDAVLRTRPFSEVLQKVLGNLISRLSTDFTDVPLLQQRTAKKVLLVLVSGDRGLCGGYNNYVIKKTEQRISELSNAGVDVELFTIGNKGSIYFRRRDTPLRRSFDCGQAPTAKEASAISEELLAEYISGE
eukprot:IDg12657t1